MFKNLRRLYILKSSVFYYYAIVLLLLLSYETLRSANNLLSSSKNLLNNQDTIRRELDTSLYLQKIFALAKNDQSGLWPVHKTFPRRGALLPFHRIVAYYGNFYSPNMGILGQYSTELVIDKLKMEMNQWMIADSSTKVIPAIHYIAVTAQKDSGLDRMYRLRMPYSQIDKAIRLARKIDGLVFLDIQLGLSTVQLELPKLRKYLSMPDVHLALDPEYAIKTDSLMGKVIGTLDAVDINYASKYLADLVMKFDLPPKILVVHRFTKNMLTNTQKIIQRPEVQIVIHMDGFGSPDKKITSYNRFIYKEPVQFTGFKVFYKNDANSGFPLMDAEAILKLVPKPIYIQYQ